MKITIYRIENKEQEGPYTGIQKDYRNAWATRSHSTTDNPNTPGPFYDNLNLNNVHNYRFGFKTLEQLKNWFSCPKELEKLHNHGFRLSIYKLNRQAVAFGGKQVAFNFDKAKRVTAMPLTKLAKVA